MNGISHVLWMLVFLLLGSALLGVLACLQGFGQKNLINWPLFQNLSSCPQPLSGVFYPSHSLPSFWQKATHLNPFFYMIDGFRYGFFGVSDVNPWLSLGMVGVALLLVSACF